MADNERKFSHISVSSDEDDEFVIEAGAPAAGKRYDGSAAGFGAESRIARPEETQALREGLEAPREEADAPVRSQVGNAGAPAPRVSQKGAHSASEKSSPLGAQAKRKDESYQPTTLEDLKGTPMSTMQKVIIALALAGIVAAVVYYVVFFG